MKINKTEKILRLLIYLCKHPQSSKSTILKEINCDERTFFNYIHDIREVGFIINCKSGHYSLMKKNEAARCFNQIININNEDSFMVHSAINKLNISESRKSELLNNFALSLNKKEDEKNNRPIFHKIISSQENKKQVIIRKHKSNLTLPNSFICEIYAHDEKQKFCWLYIPTENTNYKIHIEDIISISTSPLQWMYPSRHLKIERDLFNSYGVIDKKISITLDKQGAIKLIEEFPASKISIKKEENTDNYIFNTFACEYAPIISFILRNIENIKEINNADLDLYIQKWILDIKSKYYEKINQPH